MRTQLPERINVMKIVTYDFQKISDDIFEATGLRPETVTEAVDWIEDWVQEDFGSTRDLIFQDENGEDV
jgi:hypothetical protein